MKLSQLLSVALLLGSLGVAAQTVSGTVTDAGEPIIGATISAGATGTVTDIDGTYSLDLRAAGTYTLTASYIGYTSQTREFTLTTGQTVTWNVVLEGGATNLEELVVVGSRTAPRSSTTSPLPVDVFKSEDLTSTGQATFDKALQYRVPSFNTVQTPVNDATSLLDPYEIRNMGPSRTLILINGKRKNMSSLLYTQTSPGRGETGSDISAIPTDAIKRVEILRDGASAQYGSDAIAGVMNIVLKDNAEDGTVTLRTGITTEGDGEQLGIALNNGTAIGESGFINYTIDLSKISQANRPGTVDAAGEAGDFGASIEDVQSFLNRYPDAGNINGSPETTASKFVVNFGSDVSDNTKFYGNAAYVYKKVNSFANYRTPYWRTLADFPYLADFFPNGPNGEYIGYVPTFEGNLNDYNGTIGFLTEKDGWIADVSFTTGGNEQTYTVSNSHNRNMTLNPDSTFKYRENSPITFDPGGTRFTHNVGNIDVTRRLSDKVGIAFGSEFRNENFTVIEGELASYEDGGADSFAGNDPRNSGNFNRFNFGGYADAAFDFTDDFLVNATVRLENYSDFGNAFVYKVSSRYKFAEDKVTLRGSFSTGFKAPTLHQIYTQKAQYSFVPGQGIQVGGLVSNVSREARLLGLPALEPEKSTNFTVGVGLRPNSDLSITLDYYNIKVEDRIILSTEIGSTEAGNTQLDELLADNNLSDLSFFVNGLDTRTSGIDFVANYRGLRFNDRSLVVNLSGNYTLQNERIGAVKNPEIVAGAGQSVANPTQEALFFTSRPKYKAILGLDYDWEKFGVSVNNTLFGPTEFRQQGLATGLYTEFETKVVTDLSLFYRATEKFTLQFNANNIFNVLPEWNFKSESAAGDALLNDAAALRNQSNLITFNQRYSQMTYDGYHFSQLGTILTASASLRF
ncbi:iron complex outermembrane receptor protein [Lewinella aquimaris]|uniref:Iron complex outermembrane receptor protein n=1 Tax=Neolewinella aquimaris TaxID=1835722 RepID=A0A840EBX4_9BACT|nr:TonB-dependent receptor [Neolewinella aquimaris]MBB4078476.1 iron complex outermembrane receptor protein [Neolewinella aquimaris]